ncbi:MAG: TonB-dependent receptor [Burkholderiales bacterium]|nr:TonB-dependent receptor [Burkholderiales bacterium]
MPNHHNWSMFVAVAAPYRLLLPSSRRTAFWLSAVALGMASSGIHANETDELFNIELEELLKVRVNSATKIAQNVNEAPGIVNVVTRQQIDQFGWNSLNDILAAQPGFSLSMDYDRHTVAARGVAEGWGNNHLLLLIDGIPMNDNIFASAYTWDITPLFLAQNVEVLRGPGSALYGSSAMNGVVTINTPSAADLDYGGEAHLRLGDDGSRHLDWVHGFKGGALFSAVAGYATQATPGNEYLASDGSGRGGASSLQQFETQDRHDNWYAWVKLDGKEALRGLTVQYHDQAWHYQTLQGWALWTPDRPDVMSEERKILTVSYKPTPGEMIAQEYTVRWQDHGLRWNMNFYPNGAFGGFYPNGAREFVQTSMQDLFARAQFSFALPQSAKLLTGIEMDRYSYTGDDAHEANFNPDTGSPNAGGAIQPLGPWLDWIKDHPMVNYAPYLQFTSGDLLSHQWQLTAGLRYDHDEVTFERITDPARPVERRTFSRFSPRLGLVYLPMETVSVKLLHGSAFRAPGPAGLASAHTYSIASNIDAIQPERITTSELAVNWQIGKAVSWRSNLFETEFSDIIYASGTNLSKAVNVLTQRSRGLETELLFGNAALTGFVNASYARRVGERVIDTSVAASPHNMTWYPSFQANLGVNCHQADSNLALSLHYQGRVNRRDSEVGVQPLPFGVGTLVDLSAYRGNDIAPWWTLDAKYSQSLGHGVDLFVGGTNLLDTHKNILIKTGAFPFDYPQTGRRLYAGLSLRY